MFIGQNGGNQFSLDIMDYQFPGNRSNTFDANWLTIKIVAMIKEGQWEKQDPALLTWEVQQLIDWLKLVIADQEQWRCLAFTEPSIWFEIADKQGENVVLAVYLSLEFKAPGQKGDRTTLLIETTKDQLAQWVEFLQRRLDQYPMQVIVPSF